MNSVIDRRKGTNTDTSHQDRILEKTATNINTNGTISDHFLFDIIEFLHLVHEHHSRCHLFINKSIEQKSQNKFQ